MGVQIADEPHIFVGFLRLETPGWISHYQLMRKNLVLLVRGWIVWNGKIPSNLALSNINVVANK